MFKSFSSISPIFFNHLFPPAISHSSRLEVWFRRRELRGRGSAPVASRAALQNATAHRGLRQSLPDAWGPLRGTHREAFEGFVFFCFFECFLGCFCFCLIQINMCYYRWVVVFVLGSGKVGMCAYFRTALSCSVVVFWMFLNVEMRWTFEMLVGSQGL